MQIRHVASALCLASVLPGCASDLDKGPEDDPLYEYESKSDSFRNPTLHGPLLFGSSQSARLQEDERFHAWDFELSDDADVSLATSTVTAEVDTVMYLYKRDPVTGSFGSFKFKNDDANDDTVTSALDKALDAGQYRVVVKGFKSSIRGTFAMGATCDGPGCATSSCDVDTFAGSASFTSEPCGVLFSDALSGRQTADSGASVTLAERCALPEQASAAVEYYVAYFGGEDEFEENFNFGDPDEPVAIEVEWQLYDNGTAYVQVDGGGDEAALDFLINADGQVIAHYLHNQSPDHTLYCDGGEEFLEDGECFFEYVDTFPHSTSAERTASQTVTGATAQGSLERPALVAYQAYVAELGIADDKNVTVSSTVWDVGNESAAGRISVRQGNKKAFHYELVAHPNTQWQFTVKRGSAANREYDCKEL